MKPPCLGYRTGSPDCGQEEHHTAPPKSEVGPKTSQVQNKWSLVPPLHTSSSQNVYDIWECPRMSWGWAAFHPPAYIVDVVVWMSLSMASPNSSDDQLLVWHSYIPLGMPVPICCLLNTPGQKLPIELLLQYDNVSHSQCQRTGPKGYCSDRQNIISSGLPGLSDRHPPPLGCDHLAALSPFSIHVQTCGLVVDLNAFSCIFLFFFCLLDAKSTMYLVTGICFCHSQKAVVAVVA